MFVTPGYAQEALPPALGEVQEVEHAPQEHGGFPPFDPTHFASQIFWLAIIFGLFYLYLKRVAVPRVGSIIEVRRGRIASDLDQATKMKTEADAAVAAYEQELAEARAKANLIGQEARDAAKAEAEARRKQVEAELEGKLSAAEREISRIKTAALAEVGSIAEETAEAMIEHLLGGKADKARIVAAVKASGG